MQEIGDQCAGGYVGLRCSVCDTGNGFARNPVGQCSQCGPGEADRAVALMIFGAFVVLPAILMLGYWWLKKRSLRVNALLDALSRRSVKLKIMIGFVQVLSRMTVSFRLRLPRLSLDFLNLMAYLDIFDIFSMSANMRCVYSSSYYTKLYLQTLGPLLALVLIFGAYRITKNAALYDMALFISFLVYAPTCNALFMYFDCQLFEDGLSYLVPDPTIFCTDDRYIANLPFVVVSVLLYSVGIPAWYFWLLQQYRDQINPPAPDQHLLDLKRGESIPEAEFKSMMLLHFGMRLSALESSLMYDTLRVESGAPGDIKWGQVYALADEARPQSAGDAAPKLGSKPRRRLSICMGTVAIPLSFDEMPNAHLTSVRGNLAFLIYLSECISGDENTLQWKLMNRNANEDVQTVKFLYNPYKPEYYWFEIFEMLRKFSMTSLPLLLRLMFNLPGLDMMMGELIMTGSVVFYTWCNPFANARDQGLMTPSQMQLLVTLIGGVFMRMMGGSSAGEALVTALIIGTCLPVVFAGAYSVYDPEYDPNEQEAANVVQTLIGGLVESHIRSPITRKVVFDTTAKLMIQTDIDRKCFLHGQGVLHIRLFVKLAQALEPPFASAKLGHTAALTQGQRSEVTLLLTRLNDFDKTLKKQASFKRRASHKLEKHWYEGKKGASAGHANGAWAILPEMRGLLGLINLPSDFVQHVAKRVITLPIEVVESGEQDGLPELVRQLRTMIFKHDARLVDDVIPVLLQLLAKINVPDREVHATLLPVAFRRALAKAGVPEGDLAVDGAVSARRQKSVGGTRALLADVLGRVGVIAQSDDEGGVRSWVYSSLRPVLDSMSKVSDADYGKSVEALLVAAGLPQVDARALVFAVAVQRTLVRAGLPPAETTLLHVAGDRALAVRRAELTKEHPAAGTKGEAAAGESYPEKMALGSSSFKSEKPLEKKRRGSLDIESTLGPLFERHGSSANVGAGASGHVDRTYAGLFGLIERPVARKASASAAGSSVRVTLGQAEVVGPPMGELERLQLDPRGRLTSRLRSVARAGIQAAVAPVVSKVLKQLAAITGPQRRKTRGVLSITIPTLALDERLLLGGAAAAADIEQGQVPHGAAENAGDQRMDAGVLEAFAQNVDSPQCQKMVDLFKKADSTKGQTAAAAARRRKAFFGFLDFCTKESKGVQRWPPLADDPADLASDTGSDSPGAVHDTHGLDELARLRQENERFRRAAHIAVHIAPARSATQEQREAPADIPSQAPRTTTAREALAAAHRPGRPAVAQISAPALVPALVTDKGIAPAKTAAKKGFTAVTVRGGMVGAGEDDYGLDSNDSNYDSSGDSNGNSNGGSGSSATAAQPTTPAAQPPSPAEKRLLDRLTLCKPTRPNNYAPRNSKLLPDGGVMNASGSPVSNAEQQAVLRGETVHAVRMELRKQRMLSFMETEPAFRAAHGLSTSGAGGGAHAGAGAGAEAGLAKALTTKKTTKVVV
jgi:hypothetical protein